MMYDVFFFLFLRTDITHITHTHTHKANTRALALRSFVLQNRRVHYSRKPLVARKDVQVIQPLQVSMLYSCLILVYI